MISYAVITGLSIALAVAFYDMRYYRRLANAGTAELASRQSRDEQARGVATEFLNCCRLLSIHRNGRLNVFTFAHGDQIFTIETMGLLSDNPDEWRIKAGLTQ